MDGRRILDLGSNCLLELIETRLAAWFLHPEIGGMLIKFLLELRTTGSEWRLRRTLHSRPERWLTGLVLASEVLDALQLLSQPCNIFDSLDTLRDVLRDLPRANSFGNYPSELGDRLGCLGGSRHSASAKGNEGRGNRDRRGHRQFDRQVLQDALELVAEIIKGGPVVLAGLREFSASV